MDRFADEAMYNQREEWEEEQEHLAAESAGAEADIKAQEEMEMAKEVSKNFENVKKILETSSLDTKLKREVVASEICQLKEPKPDERLLTEDKICEILNKTHKTGQIYFIPERLLIYLPYFGEVMSLLKAQLAKDEAECQAKIDEIFKKIEKPWKLSFGT